jgi:hypothetical protein
MLGTPTTDLRSALLGAWRLHSSVRVSVDGVDGAPPGSDHDADCLTDSAFDQAVPRKERPSSAMAQPGPFDTVIALLTAAAHAAADTSIP